MEVVLDYGIRLFRHVVQQVFGNLGQAARITAAPFLLFVLIAYLLVGEFLIDMFRISEAQQSAGGALTEEELAEQFGDLDAVVGQAFGTLLLIPIGLMIFGWVAVAWHRFVLAEEYGGLVPQFSLGRVGGYVWRSILIFLLLFLVSIPLLLILGGLLVNTVQSGGGFGFGLLIAMGFSFLFSWVLVRWSLILPAWSVDQRMTIGESWKVTQDVSGEILVPILGFAIIFPAIQQILVFVPVGGTILGLFVSWIQMLVNLALLTTLYGNLVQGRELN